MSPFEAPITVVVVASRDESQTGKGQPGCLHSACAWIRSPRKQMRRGHLPIFGIYAAEVSDAPIAHRTSQLDHQRDVRVTSAVRSSPIAQALLRRRVRSSG